MMLHSGFAQAILQALLFFMLCALAALAALAAFANAAKAALAMSQASLAFSSLISTFVKLWRPFKGDSSGEFVTSLPKQRVEVSISAGIWCGQVVTP